MAGAGAAALDPGTIAAVLTDTAFGHVWCLRLAVAAALVAAACVPRQRGLQLALAAVLLASLGWVGHAAMAPGLIGLGHKLNQTLHLLAGGLWLGGLIPLGWLLRRVQRRPDAEWVDMLRVVLPPFSRMGYGAVAVLALTGAVNTALLVGSAGRLLTTPYGRLLTLKIVLFIVMVAVAAGNRFRLAPRVLAGTESPDALAHAVLAEQVLGLAILAVVSVLGTWAPAAQGAAM
jgi:copper resistance protein D